MEPAPSTSLGPVNWQPPNSSHIKFNWDATAKKATLCTGIGGLVRDSAGEVLTASSSIYPWALPPNITEASTLRHMLLLSHDLGFRNVIFEVDCLKVVTAVHNKIPTNDALSPIIHDIQQILLGHPHWTVAYTPKNLNRGADFLANIACSNHCNSIWIEEYPSCIEIVVQEEKRCIPLTS